MGQARGAGPILLLTHSGDFYTIDRVEAAVRARGAEVLRVDTDRFPADAQLTARFAGATGHTELWLELDQARVDLLRVPAVWSRRLWPGHIPASVEPRFRAHCQRAARTLFFEALALLDGAFWINPLGAGTRAESKLLQLRAASDLGFRLPETLVTNAAAPVRELYRRSGGRAITKLLTPLSQTMDASGAFVYTSRLSDTDLDALRDLQLAPMIFQPLVDKVEELRVIVCEERFFVGAVRFEDAHRRRVDWRAQAPGEHAAWSVRTLSPTLEARILRLLGRLGLVFAAIDLIDPGDGCEPVFLELNPAGEWGWLERDLDLPIADAIAGALVRGAAQTEEERRP